MDDDRHPKFSINGLKLNAPLAAFWIDDADHMIDLSTGLCRLLNRNCVNIAYMTAADSAIPGPGLYCIDLSEAAKVAGLIDDDPDIRGKVKMGRDVGLMTFYPHRWSFEAMGLVLQLFGEQDIRIHGMASSISALSFVIDLEQMASAASLLNRRFQLPANSTPPELSIKVKQERFQ